MRCTGWYTVVLSFHEAQQVLDEFRERFIQEMDASAVVLDLVHYDIINRGNLRTITRTEDPSEQNKFLHLYLKERCTEDAFLIVCDIISNVKGNPKMRALGTAMRRTLETGKCVCAHVCVCVCTFVFEGVYWVCHSCRTVCGPPSVSPVLSHCTPCMSSVSCQLSTIFHT